MLNAPTPELVAIYLEIVEESSLPGKDSVRLRCLTRAILRELESRGEEGRRALERLRAASGGAQPLPVEAREAALCGYTAQQRHF